LVLKLFFVLLKKFMELIVLVILFEELGKLKRNWSEYPVNIIMKFFFLFDCVKLVFVKDILEDGFNSRYFFFL